LGIALTPKESNIKRITAAFFMIKRIKIYSNLKKNTHKARNISILTFTPKPAVH